MLRVDWVRSKFVHKDNLKKKLENSFLGLGILCQLEANAIYWAQGQNGQMRSLRGMLEILNHPCVDWGGMQPGGRGVDQLSCVEAPGEAIMPPVLISLWISLSSTSLQEGQKNNRVHQKLECFWIIEGIEVKGIDNIIKSGQNGSGLIIGRNWKPEEQDGMGGKPVPKNWILMGSKSRFVVISESENWEMGQVQWGKGLNVGFPSIWNPHASQF